MSAKINPCFMPGKWIITERRAYDNALVIATPKRYSTIAYVAPQAFYNDTQQANANLIAAAPLLLAALQELLKAPNTVRPTSGMERPEQYWQDARTAVKQALEGVAT